MKALRAGDWRDPQHIELGRVTQEEADESLRLLARLAELENIRHLREALQGLVTAVSKIKTSDPDVNMAVSYAVETLLETRK